MIVAVAERREAGELTPREIMALRILWDGNPLGSMLEARAPGGRFGAQLYALLGNRLPWGVLDLLPPGPSGTWEGDRARRNAALVARWAHDHGHALILLGRRVAGSFDLETATPYGEMGYLETEAPYLLLPHPAARNRWRNRSRLEAWIRTFWTYYGQEMIE